MYNNVSKLKSRFYNLHFQCSIRFCPITESLNDPLNKPAQAYGRRLVLLSENIVNTAQLLKISRCFVKLLADIFISSLFYSDLSPTNSCCVILNYQSWAVFSQSCSRLSSPLLFPPLHTGRVELFQFVIGFWNGMSNITFKFTILKSVELFLSSFRYVQSNWKNRIIRLL